jgi:hypothetical protein
MESLLDEGLRKAKSAENGVKPPRKGTRSLRPDRERDKIHATSSLHTTSID